MSARARVGLFGGAFDPPHRAHRAVVEAALGQLALDRILVLPTGQAWHKSRPLSPAEHRIAMARLAFGDMPRVFVDDRETRRTGPSYTIDTLTELQAEQPQARFHLLIGQDQAERLPTWRDWEQILQRATVCVARRATPPAARADASWTSRLVTLELPPMDLSATQVRARCARGEPIDALVAEPVARYIALHHLYRPT